MSTAARIEELRKKFEENPRRYFAPLANELRKAGELTQAIALCREHLPKQPGHMSGYIVFGQALYESGDLDEARVVFEQALALDPENLIALHHLGHIAKQVGDTHAARRWYERALETDPRNDDIAHQLAALTTPIRPQAAVPTPAQAMPSVPTPPEMSRAQAVDLDDELAFLDTGPLSPRRDLETIPTPSYPQAAIGAMPLAPTPDASMRAVDFDAVNESLRHHEPPAAPEPIDLAIDLSSAISSDVSTAESIDLDMPEPVLPTGQAMADDPFAFADEIAPGLAFDVAASPVDLEAAFEEGLVSAWPDTTDFAARAATPRESTPIGVDVTPEAAEAFGLEPEDPILAALPEPEPDVFVDEVDLALPDIDTVTRSPADPIDLSLDDVVVPPSELAPVMAIDEVDDVTSAADPQEDLPWLAAPVTPAEDMTAIVHALEEDARALGEPDDVSVFARSDDEATFLPEPELVASDESSFNDVHPAEPQALFDDAEELPAADESEASETPAFVTETMGELLVAQGFLDRAVSVYEELVRRRPYDPVLSARLAELQAQVKAAVPVAIYTARERYATLAARRVVRRTPARSATPVATWTPVVTPVIASSALATPRSATPPATSALDSAGEGAHDSLAALFGSKTATHDDFAAQALADAFAPSPLDDASPSSFSDGFLGASDSQRELTPAYGAVRQPTPAAVSPVSVSTPSRGQGTAPTPAENTLSGSSNIADTAAEFSFDRFFPDPAGTPGENPPGTPTSTPVVMPPTSESAAAGEPSASDDLAQFSAWLKGLGNA